MEPGPPARVFQARKKRQVKTVLKLDTIGMESKVTPATTMTILQKTDAVNAVDVNIVVNHRRRGL